jgi:hypothetical protein
MLGTSTLRGRGVSEDQGIFRLSFGEATILAYRDMNEVWHRGLLGKLLGKQAMGWLYARDYPVGRHRWNSGCNGELSRSYKADRI